MPVVARVSLCSCQTAPALWRAVRERVAAEPHTVCACCRGTGIQLLFMSEATVTALSVINFASAIVMCALAQTAFSQLCQGWKLLFEEARCTEPGPAEPGPALEKKPRGY